MANRPVFLPQYEGDLLVETRMVEFTWAPGMARSQKQRSIENLHGAARETLDIESILEISTKSPDDLGVALSAFNLTYTARSGRTYPLESLFQSAKVFSEGGPYRDLRDKPPLAAKQDPRLLQAGRLTGFKSGEFTWPLEPKTVFYDWLYLNVLHTKRTHVQRLFGFDGFTDIEFNPKRSINCQAHSAALFVALERRGLMGEALASQQAFLAIMNRFARGSTVGDTPATGFLI